MVKKLMKKYLKNQRGLTLIELLAVIVILGIIAAIAVPSISGIINNSKKDAVIANAIQMVDAGKLYIADGQSISTGQITLQSLKTGNYIDDINNPFSGSAYSETKSFLTVTNGKIVSVTLDTSNDAWDQPGEIRDTTIAELTSKTRSEVK